MIPRYIHRIWLGGNEPSQFRLYGQTWKDHHPNWEVVQWDGPGELFPLQNQDLYDDPDYWCPNGSHGQFRADLLRYEILWRYGGLYVDADFECLAPVDYLIKDTKLFAGWEVQDQWIANGFMGAEPHHPFINTLITGVRESLKRYRKNRPASSTGPQFLTRLYKRGLANDMYVVPRRYLYPYSYRDVGTPKAEPPWPDDAVAVHHWNNTRNRVRAS